MSTPPGMPDVASVMARLATIDEAQRKIEINSNPAGERKVWLTMATQNAELAIGQRLAVASRRPAD